MRAHPIRPAAPAVTLLAAVIMAQPAAGQIPTPSNSIVPCGLALVPPGFTSPAFDYQAEARDLANHPMVGAEVRIDFTGCGADARPAVEQPPGITVDCATRSLFALTDAQGRVTMRIVGGASGGPPQAFSGHGCAQVFIDGVLVRNAHVGVLDLDGAGGLTIADLSIWLSDLFNHTVPPDYAARSDYDYVEDGCNEQIGIPDLNIWVAAFLSQEAVYGAPLCGP